jgi:hypothetical protein
LDEEEKKKSVNSFSLGIFYSNISNSMRTQGVKPHEKELVNLYTPYIMNVLQEVNPHLRLVNSECYAWLRCASGRQASDLKPDLFTAHHALIQYLPAYQNAPRCNVKRHFGKYISWESRASVHCVWDAKWTIDYWAFGQKSRYLQIAGEGCVDHNGAPPRLKGLLFDVTEFWMIRSSGNIIVDVVTCKWSQARSCWISCKSVTRGWRQH